MKKLFGIALVLFSIYALATAWTSFQLQIVGTVDDDPGITVTAPIGKTIDRVVIENRGRYKQESAASGGVGTLNTFTVATAAWATGEWIGATLTDSAAKTFVVSANTATALTVAGTPTTGDGSYSIVSPNRDYTDSVYVMPSSYADYSGYTDYTTEPVVRDDLRVVYVASTNRNYARRQVSPVTITAASKASDCILTVTEHPVDVHDGDYIWIEGVVGMTELNNVLHTVASSGVDHDAAGGYHITITTDSSTYTTYTSGGYGYSNSCDVTNLLAKSSGGSYYPVVSSAVVGHRMILTFAASSVPAAGTIDLVAPKPYIVPGGATIDVPLNDYADAWVVGTSGGADVVGYCIAN